MVELYALLLKQGCTCGLMVALATAVIRSEIGIIFASGCVGTVC